FADGLAVLAIVKLGLEIERDDDLLGGVRGRGLGNCGCCQEGSAGHGQRDRTTRGDCPSRLMPEGGNDVWRPRDETLGNDPGETHGRSLLPGLGWIWWLRRHRGLLGRRCRGRGQPLEVLPVQLFPARRRRLL